MLATFAAICIRSPTPISTNRSARTSSCAAKESTSTTTPGKRYIEGLSGLWCAALGFSEKRLVDAATRQLNVLPFYHNFSHKAVEPAIELADYLVGRAPAPMSKVFFTNSGSEANDTQVKLVWYYNNILGRPNKKKIIARKGAYHGITVAAGSLTGLSYAQTAFDLPIANILHADCPHYYRYGNPTKPKSSSASVSPPISKR